MPKEMSWPLSFCPHCKWARKLSTPHRHWCPALVVDKRPYYHEVYPRLFVGSVDARVDPRFVAVVSILSEANVRWIGSHVAQPSVPTSFIDHEDCVDGLLGKCPAAFDHIDRYIVEGDVLVHCHQGASRSPSVAAGWLVDRRGYKAEAAIKEVYTKRPPAMHMFTGYVREVEALERP